MYLDSRELVDLLKVHLPSHLDPRTEGLSKRKQKEKCGGVGGTGKTKIKNK